jgi:UDP-N-acetylmuramate dehydrogenase
VFITKLEPPGGNPDPDPVAILDDDIGSWPEYGGLSPRSNREVYIIDGRGSGHSEPSLACPEVDEIRATTLVTATDDEQTRATFLDAVAACHERLTAGGIDLSAYHLSAMAADAEDLRAARDAVVATGVGVLVVGKGSNLLVADTGFDGLVIVLGEGFAAIDVEGDTVRAGGSAALPVVARRAVAASLTGFEWAVGVPGSIGGAVRMNAGGHGAELAETLVSIRAVDLAGGEDGEVPAARLDLGYRRSNLRPSTVVVEATLGLASGDRAEGEAVLAEIVRWRREHQPGGPNAGSVFTNPPGDSAGRLIDAAGLKGHRLGTAEVSSKHANFIQADPGGRAADVRALMAEVQRRVAEHSGVALHAETVLVGFDGPNPRVEVEG